MCNVFKEVFKMAEYVITVGNEEEDSIIGNYDSDPEPNDRKEDFCSAGDALKLILDNIENYQINIDDLAEEMDSYNSNIIGVDIIDEEEQPIISYTFTVKATKHFYN